MGVNTGFGCRFLASGKGPGPTSPLGVKALRGIQETRMGLPFEEINKKTRFVLVSLKEPLQKGYL